VADGSLSVSGTRTNLKGGGGHRSGTKRRKKIGRAPPLFGSNSAISRYGERFRDGQYSLVSFLFAVLLLTVPPCPGICKSGGNVPLVPHGVGVTAFSNITAWVFSFFLQIHNHRGTETEIQCAT